MKIFAARRQWWGAAVLSLATLVLVGCGEQDACDLIDCGEGAQCVDGTCVEVGTDDCDPECDDGELCTDGRCVSEEGGCDYHGQACRSTDTMEWHDEYLCLDWRVGVGDEAQCSQDCRTQPCPEGSECFLLDLGMSASCAGDGECAEREVCVDGQCLVAACRSSECDATKGNEGCRIGERCDRIGTGVDLCMPEGTQQPGESCLEPTEVYQQQRFSEGCASDSVCVGGICRSYCDEGQCGEADEECQARSLGPGLGQVDVCAQICDPEEEHSCGDGEFCAPTVDGEGMCQPVGDVPDFEACTIGQNDCKAGSVCAEVESGQPLGRCLPVCDLSVGQFDDEGQLSGEGQRARDETCPQPEPARGVWMMGHLVEAGEPVDLYVDGEAVAEMKGGELARFDGEQFYEMRPPGSVDWAVRQAGAPSTDVPVAEGQFYLDSAQSKIVVLTAVPGEDRDLDAEVIELSDSGEKLQWIQGIPDLDSADVWAAQEGEEATKWIDGFSFGQARGGDVAPGVYEVWVVAKGEGAEGDRLLEFSEMEIEGDERLLALGGTMDIGDIHSPAVAVVYDRALPKVEESAPLPLTCRAVNDDMVGGCMERCDGDPGLETGRCQGEGMGCGPRDHEERQQWSSVCQPVGDFEEGEPCNPDASRACGEGLYCELVGDAIDDWSQTNQRGRCAPLCAVGDGAGCGEERACRPMDGAGDYDVGECRATCAPDGQYTDPGCPSGLRRCLPEAELVPGAEGMIDVEEREPMCWAAGTSEIGEQCVPGNCVPGSECIFERSQQPGFVESMLSPYMPTAGVFPRCRPICDPFTDQHSDHQCPQGQTCLFNFPWNANVGHCTEIEEDLDIGDPCEKPGLSCGEDSICVMDGGVSQCVRFCQFTGPDGSGYERSTCPMGHQCRPLIRDIGVCD